MTDARLLPTPAQPRRSTHVLTVVVIDIVVDGTRVQLIAWSTCPRTDEPITHAEVAK